MRSRREQGGVWQLAILGLVLTAWPFARTVATDSPYPADFGDAPDGQNAGYAPPYASVVGRFPTLYTTANSRYARPGGHAISTGQEWLGSLVSIEDGPDDPGDPDVVENFLDDDFDDGVAGGLCPSGTPPVPWPSPLSVTLPVRITVAPAAPATARYLNILLDRNHDGVWSGPGEWIAVDYPVSVAPGTSAVVSVGPFAYPLATVSSWMRVALTRAPIVGTFSDNGTGWDGSGAFPYGEVEDYLLASDGALDHAAAAAGAAARASSFAQAVVDEDAHAVAITLALASVDVSAQVAAAASASASAAAAASSAASGASSASASASAAAGSCATALGYASSLAVACASCPCASICASAQAAALAAVDACSQAQVSAEVSASAAANASAYASAEAVAAATAHATASARASAFAAALAVANAHASAIAVARASATAAASAASSSAATALSAACAGDASAAAAAAASAGASASSAASAFAAGHAEALAIAESYAVAEAEASATAGAAAAAQASAAAAGSASATAASEASAGASAAASASAISLSLSSAGAEASASCSGDCCPGACAICWTLTVARTFGMAAHVTWSAAAGAVSYDLVAGTMLGGPVYCLANNTPQHEANDPGIAVAPGHALYYLERSFSGTEDDIWGRTSTGAPRADTGACSSGCTPSVCDDHNVCTVDGCDGGSHDCTHTLISCDDGNGCTTDTCDPQGGCAHLPRTGFCDDGTACTQGDACQNGTCLGSPLDCNDGNPCTADACDPGTGCVYSLLNQACDDGRACTANDHCAAGQCTGNVVTCDDGSPCTNDYCNDDTGCGHTPRTGSCEDGDFCTTQDSCQSGACVGGPPASCDDGNSCTEDVCSPSVGCAHAPRTGSCDDGNACTTGDTCAGGLCAGGPPASCDDGNSCTSDFCSAPQGCVHEPVFGPCNDGNPCTTGEACAEGTCGGGVVTTCDDGNACTDDSCLEGGGCLFTIDDTNACSDGNPCTADRCSAGICVSDPGAPVTQTFASPAPILIPATGTSGQAGPYPSILTLPPLGPLVSLQVQLNGLNHAFPDDIDMLLVGPTGQDAKILSDVGGNIPAHVNLILDDLAPASLPDAGPLVSGTFKPTNIGPADSFPGAPLPTGNTNLSIFNGSPPGGTWSLYIFDDSGIGGAGSLQNGWALVVTSQCLGAAPLLEASTSGGTRYVPVAASARRSGTSTKSADRSDTGPPGPSEPTQMTGEGR